MGQAQINVRTRACSGTFIARTKQAALTHNVRGKELNSSCTQLYAVIFFYSLYFRIYPTLAEDGELAAEVTYRVQKEWKNRMRVSGSVMRQENQRDDQGKVYRTVVRPALIYRGRDMGIEEGPGNEIGSRRNVNATMDVRSYEAGQDKKF